MTATKKTAKVKKSRKSQKSKKPTKTDKRGKHIRYSPKIRNIIKILALKGFTDVEISEVIGITKQTLNNWKNRYPKFFDSLSDWKLQADKTVERALYERAQGYEHADVHISNYQGEITITDITKHYAPDPTSIIFWLKNRQPDKWRDKKEHGFTGKDGEDLKWQVEVVEAKAKDGQNNQET